MSHGGWGGGGGQKSAKKVSRIIWLAPYEQPPFCRFFREWLDSNEDGVKPSIIGTTAEIFEYFEPSAESLEVGLKIKAKGRQRFKVINSHSQIDGWAKLYRVCHGLRLTKRGDYFRVNIDHFWTEPYFWGSWAVVKIGLSLKPDHLRQI